MIPSIAYKATSKDLLRVKVKRNKLKVSGDGVFATLQGEGATTGLPAVFLRLHFCNLSCGSISGWKCDTGYTWDKTKKEFWQEPQDWGYEETAIKIEKEWNNKFSESDPANRRMVITGGEPLLQQRKIIELLKYLPEWNVEIETNGTITPLPGLCRHQFNCSPKLENSGNSQQTRYKQDVLKTINSFPSSWFKFVAVAFSDLKEIDQIVSDCGLYPNKILIMPEGQTKEEVSEHADILSSEVLKRRWNLTLRNQLIWFGPKRKT